MLLIPSLSHNHLEEAVSAVIRQRANECQLILYICDTRVVGGCCYVPWPAGLQRDAAPGREADVMSRGSRSLAEARNGQAYLHCARYQVDYVGRGRRKGCNSGSKRE